MSEEKTRVVWLKRKITLSKKGAAIIVAMVATGGITMCIGILCMSFISVVIGGSCAIGGMCILILSDDVEWTKKDTKVIGILFGVGLLISFVWGLFLYFIIYFLPNLGRVLEA